MKNQRPLKQFMGHLAPIVVRPPVQSLVDLEPSSPWDQSILAHKAVTRASLTRRTLNAQLELIFGKVQSTQMDIGEALTLGLVQESELRALYRNLIKFLTEEEYSERLLLYFPIELIPGNDWKISARMRRVADDFIEVYVRAWHLLLLRQDTRANFVDGDIPENEMRTGPLPKVVKAAHLIPALISKGILSYEDACIMMDECSNPILRMSIQEILPYCLPPRPMVRENPITQDYYGLVRHIKQACSDLQALNLSHTPTNKPASRVAWEMERDRSLCIDRYSNIVAQVLVHGSFSITKLESLIAKDGRQVCLQIIVSALQKTLESVAEIDLGRAKSLYLDYAPQLTTIWQREESCVRESLERLWLHIFNIGLIDRTVLDEHGIRIPTFLDDAYMSSDSCKTAQAIARTIESDRELSSLILPVVLVYGSQVKGYATHSADNDIALFIRPDVDITSRTYVQGILSELLRSNGIIGKVLEFWTEKSAGCLKIRDFKNPDKLLGDSMLIQILFGGIWLGNQDVIRNMYRDVLTPYLFSKSGSIDGQPIREVWLEEMERDALQYRLMHKGYHYSFPRRITRCIPVGTRDSGAFWDSGFRRLATRIFLKKVFLPCLLCKE